MNQAIALLATGDEITHGDTLNSNAYDMAHALASHGLTPGLHCSTPDDENLLINSLQFLLQHHDIVLTIGGLGPTSDDRTRFALAKVIGQELTFSEQAWQHIQDRFTGMNLQLSESNKQQCLFPGNAKLLPNPYGTALGAKIQSGSKILYMLPGPPRECLPMFNHFVLPELAKQHQSKHILKKWRIFGLPEGQLGELLDQAVASFDCQTGYRWEYPYIEFKVLTVPEQLPSIEAAIMPIIENYLISPADKPASQVLAEQLKQWNIKLQIKDRATGGFLQKTLSSPSLFKTLSFDSEVASTHQVIIHGLDDYWQQKSKGKTQLIIKFSTPDMLFQEQHELPYRNDGICHYATEFITYRISQWLRDEMARTNRAM